MRVPQNVKKRLASASKPTTQYTTSDQHVTSISVIGMPARGAVAKYHMIAHKLMHTSQQPMMAWSADARPRPHQTSHVAGADGK